MYVSCTQESGCTHVAQIKRRRGMPKYARNATTHFKTCTGLSLKCRWPNAWHNVARVGEDWSSTNWIFICFWGIFHKATPPSTYLVHGVDGGASTWLWGPEISNRSLSHPRSFDGWPANQNLKEIVVFLAGYQGDWSFIWQTFPPKLRTLSFKFLHYFAGLLYDKNLFFPPPNIYNDHAFWKSKSSCAPRYRPFPTPFIFLFS